MAKVLIIDDDNHICTFVEELLEEEGHETRSANKLRDGIQNCEQTEFDVILLDVNLPDGNGLEALPLIQKSAGNPEVIIITGEGDPDGAELAIKTGAWDYLTKPLSVDSTLLSIHRALRYHTEKQSSADIGSYDRQGIIGNSPAINECLFLASRAAKSGLNTLITGETGTGKELFAQSIHKNSSRHKKNFVVVDCTALPKNLVESTLFGHEKGAFTGADTNREGLIKMAHRGTLFLDEIGELPLSTQKNFLRVLQEKKFRPVGGEKEKESDFTLISATNRDLDSLERLGAFRKDLLFRLRTINIELPPLRNRGNDIRLIATDFISAFCKRKKTSAKTISDELLTALYLYDWPGNVRELIGVLENILTVAGDDDVLYPDHLPISIRAKVIKSSVKSKAETKTIASPSEPKPKKQNIELSSFKKFREEIVYSGEKKYLVALMEESGWDIQQACKISELSRARLYKLLKKHRLTNKKS